jgi:hypothetical protein
MRVKLTYLMSMLAAGAAAVAISAAPIASAASVQQSCTDTASGSECASPGNVEINDTPPPVSFDPYGDEGFLLGGFGGHGGFHGGGGHR